MKIVFFILSFAPCALFSQGYIGQSPSALADKIGSPFTVRDAIIPRDYEVRVYRGIDGGPMISLYVAPDGKVRAVELSSWIENQTARPSPQFADRWAPLPKAHIDAFLESAAEGFKWETLPKESSPFILRRSDGNIVVRLERVTDANGRLETAKLVVASKEFAEAMKWIPGKTKPKY